MGFSFLIPKRRLVVSLTMLSMSPSTLDSDGLSRFVFPDSEKPSRRRLLEWAVLYHFLGTSLWKNCAPAALKEPLSSQGQKGSKGQPCYPLVRAREIFLSVPLSGLCLVAARSLQRKALICDCNTVSPNVCSSIQTLISSFCPWLMCFFCVTNLAHN